MLLETKARIIHTLIFLITMYECESWAVKKTDRIKIYLFKIYRWRRALQILWTTKKTNKWVPEKIKPKTSLEAKMTRLKLSYLGHIVRRQGSLGKTIILGKKIVGSR